MNCVGLFSLRTSLSLLFLFGRDRRFGGKRVISGRASGSTRAGGGIHRWPSPRSALPSPPHNEVQSHLRIYVSQPTLRSKTRRNMLRILVSSRALDGALPRVLPYANA